MRISSSSSRTGKTGFIVAHKRIKLNRGLGLSEVTVKPAPYREKEKELNFFDEFHDGKILMAKFNYDLEQEDKNSVSIAGFSLDHTLIMNDYEQGLNAYYHLSRKAADWRLWHSNVLGILHRVHNKGQSIVIMQNKYLLKIDSPGFKALQKRCVDIAVMINRPIVFIFATHTDFFKPNTSLWTFMEDTVFEGKPVDKSNSFFCGDLGGRPFIRGATRKKDHSAEDWLFALKNKVSYFTPETMFLQQDVDG